MMSSASTSQLRNGDAAVLQMALGFINGAALSSPSGIPQVVLLLSVLDLRFSLLATSQPQINLVSRGGHAGAAAAVVPWLPFSQSHQWPECGSTP